MIYVDIFLTFLQIGAVSFGGGYAMISLIREKVLMHGWLTENELLNMVAIAESTPGPIAVNIATFVGSNQAGILGSLVATLGVVLPSFIIILCIAAIMHNFLKYNGIQAFLSGIRPCVVALILTTSLVLLLSTVFGIKNIHSSFSLDHIGLIILCILLGIDFIAKKILRKETSPIILILLSSGIGMILYSI